MDRQIDHEHGLAALECRHQALLHINEKHRSIHGALEGDCLPVAMRCVVDQPLAAERGRAAAPFAVLFEVSSMNTSRVGLRGGLIQDQLIASLVG
jgi:hypothetical protein